VRWKFLKCLFLQVACAVGSFFLAAAANTRARKKAQEEIRRVVGEDRLPEFEDRPSLPYVEAFYREVMRWRPAMPMGVAHTTTQDDVYEGYFIPKGKPIFNVACPFHILFVVRFYYYE
jgi:cytochrome P450